jgi:crotonobetainyl-CoA:carnitine CoA-transferase CaiB-like acyl-CoA transferase
VIGLDAAKLATRSERLGARAELEAALTAWLASRSPQAAMDALQGAGVPAGRMLRVSDLPGFGYFQARGFFRVERHPRLANEVVAERFVVQAEGIADPPARPAPAFGQHTAEVVREWLGLDEAEIARLVGEGVLEPAAPESTL